MANTHRNAPQSNGSTGWQQPTTYHAISGKHRGHFVKVPHVAALDTVAEVHGEKMAALLFHALLRDLTNIGQARAKAKDVKDEAGERAAIEKAFAEFANGTLTMRGEDTDDSESAGGFAKVFRNDPTVRDTIRTALESAGKTATDANIDANITAYWEPLLARHGDRVAAAGYTPTKRGAGGSKASAEVVTGLSL